jgi:hypothetical protein
VVCGRFSGPIVVVVDVAEISKKKKGKRGGYNKPLALQKDGGSGV